MFIYKESADDLWRHWLPKREFVIDMTEYVSDPDGEQLKYTVTVSNPTVAHLNAKGDKITGTALGYGLVDVTIVAKDAKNEKVEFTFKVLLPMRLSQMPQRFRSPM